MTDNYERKDIWTRRGGEFTVTVSRHETRPSHDGEGPHRWAVYAYVYPSHPHFAAFSVNEGMWQRAAADLPLHAYPSYFRVHRDNAGAVCSFEVGADYHHDHDARFTFAARREDAGEVFRDADALWEWLTTKERAAHDARASAEETHR